MTRLTSSGRKHVLEWLSYHPRSVHGDAVSIVARAERATRRQARENAWSEARDYIERRREEWKNGSGSQASDAYVALEVCPQLARALRSRERHVREGDERDLVGEELMRLLELDAIEAIAEWTLTVGEHEHHRIWEEIVVYTRKRGRELVRTGEMQRSLDWEHCKSFSTKAARVAEILIAEFDSRATRSSRTRPRKTATIFSRP